MKTSLLLALYFAPLLTPFVFAQTPGFSPELHSEEVDTAHDLPANDPSPKPQLGLKKAEPQKKLLIRRVAQRVSEKLTPRLRKKKTSYTQLLAQDPSAFNLLSLHSHRYTPKMDYGPTAVNSDHEFADISDRKFGLCWGFATLVRDFTVLAFFDPTTAEGVPGDPSSQAWIDFYRDKIDRVLKGEATVIPGIKNFRELTMVPELELYIKIYATKLWASRAVHRSSIAILRKATDVMDPAAVDTLLTELETRLMRGEMPKIIFSSLIPSEKTLGMNTDIHVVLVYRVERLPNGGAKIHLWDINFYTETLVRDPKFIEVTPTRGFIYTPWYEPTKPYAKGSDLVAGVQLAPENDQEIADLVVSLRAFCSKSENAKYCEGNQD